VGAEEMIMMMMTAIASRQASGYLPGISAS